MDSQLSSSLSHDDLPFKAHLAGSLSPHPCQVTGKSLAFAGLYQALWQSLATASGCSFTEDGSRPSQDIHWLLYNKGSAK